MADRKAGKSSLFPRKAGTHSPAARWLSELYGPRDPPATDLLEWTRRLYLLITSEADLSDSWEPVCLTWGFGLCCKLLRLLTPRFLDCRDDGQREGCRGEEAERKWAPSLESVRARWPLPPSGEPDGETCFPLGPAGSGSARTFLSPTIAGVEPHPALASYNG